MHLIVQTYSLIELQQLRSELEKRGIRVHVSDEFTYAIPGMPGAEQPRGLWVTLEEDIAPARRVVADLIGLQRLAPAGADTAQIGTDATQAGAEICEVEAGIAGGDTTESDTTEADTAEADTAETDTVEADAETTTATTASTGSAQPARVPAAACRRWLWPAIIGLSIASAAWLLLVES